MGSFTVHCINVVRDVKINWGNGEVCLERVCFITKNSNISVWKGSGNPLK